MEVYEILSEYLVKNGYDGLYNDDTSCGCDLSDFCYCGCPTVECTAGYKAPCDCGNHTFHIQKAKKQ